MIFRNDVNKMIIWITNISTGAEYMPQSGEYKLSILWFEQKQIKPGYNRVLLVLSHHTNGKIFIGPSQDLSKEPKITLAPWPWSSFQLDSAVIMETCFMYYVHHPLSCCLSIKKNEYFN